MIYFIQSGNSGPIKIGFAVNPEIRLSQLQTANPAKLRLMKMINGGKSKEREIHCALKDHRLQGEWFDPTPEVLKYIAACGDVEWEKRGGYVFAVLWRDFEKSPTDPCPFCFQRHTHGIGDGHRVAHCSSKDVLEIKTRDVTVNNLQGYIVKTRES